MSLHQFFSILRARLRLAALMLFATLALALLWVVLRPAHYTATAPILVDVRSDPVAGNSNIVGMPAPGLMATQVDIARSERVAQRAAQLLKLDRKPDSVQRWRDATKGNIAAQPWFAHQLQQYLDVKPVRESNIINIAWTGPTRKEAAEVANAFAQAYLDVSLELKTDPARGYAAWFEDQVKSARQTLEGAQTRLSDFQQSAGIVSTDERTDYETARLNGLSAQLTAALGRRGTSAAGSDAMQSPLITNLRTDVAKLEAKIHESSEALGARHPQMVRMQAELQSLRGVLSSEAARLRSSIDSSQQAGKNGERELEGAVAAQKARVLALTKQRGQLNLLQRDVDAAQKAFDAVSTSAAQVRLQSLTQQTQVLRLAPAAEPVEATGPTGRQSMMIAAVAGVLLAVLSALLAELANRRVRSAQDLAMVTRLPVLANVPAAADAFAAFPALPMNGSRRRLGLAAHRRLG